jgi:hypothetical protein
MIPLLPRLFRGDRILKEGIVPTSRENSLYLLQSVITVGVRVPRIV